jgi:hypothetical protein
LTRSAERRAAVWSALVASLGTLVCCALPSLLVLLGFGTTVAAVVSAAPWLVVLSQNKGWVFAASGLMIMGSRLYTDRVTPRVVQKGAACPTPLGRWTRAVWWTSAGLYVVGFFVAYALGPILMFLDG